MTNETATVVKEEVAKEEADMLPVYDVLVERSNNEIIGAEVFAHEIPVLKALHGEEHVYFKGYEVGTDIEDVEPAYEVSTETNAALVLRSLHAKYNQNGQPEVVSRVYRDADELSAKMGLKKSKGRAKAVPASENIDGRKAAKKK